MEGVSGRFAPQHVSKHSAFKEDERETESRREERDNQARCTSPCCCSGWAFQEEPFLLPPWRKSSRRRALKYYSFWQLHHPQAHNMKTIILGMMSLKAEESTVVVGRKLARTECRMSEPLVYSGI